MSKIKIGFRGHNVLYQIERSRQIQTAMTGNANFPTPNPTLAAVATATDDCETAYNNAINGDKVLKAIFKARRTEMLALIGLLADYVSNTSAGDAEKILSSGFGVHGIPQPTPPMTQVKNLHLESGSSSGRIKALWNAVEAKRLYQIEKTATPLDESSWAVAGTATKTRYELTALTPGTKYYVRVRAIGKDDSTGDWSETATLICR